MNLNDLWGRGKIEIITKKKSSLVELSKLITLFTSLLNYCMTHFHFLCKCNYRVNYELRRFQNKFPREKLSLVTSRKQLHSVVCYYFGVMKDRKTNLQIYPPSVLLLCSLSCWLVPTFIYWCLITNNIGNERIFLIVEKINFFWKIFFIVACPIQRRKIHKTFINQFKHPCELHKSFSPFSPSIS